jgi:beta-lactam-binding protein with PASTA domain
VNQNPVGQTMAAPGSTVILYVSGAVQVPNVLTLTESSAETSLQTAGFKVTATIAAGPAGTAPGTVWQQQPTGQTSAAPGSSVTILVQPQAASPSPSVTPSPNGSGGTGGF